MLYLSPRMRAAEYSLGWSVAEPQVRSGFIAQARGAGDSHWPQWWWNGAWQKAAARSAGL